MKKRGRKGILFISISCAGFVFFYLIPGLISILMTLFDKADFSFIGGKIYSDLFHSQAFQIAVGNSMKFFVIAMPLILIFSFCMALAMRRFYQYHIPGTSFLMILHLLPFVIPSGVIVLLIKILFSDYGMVNGILHTMGLSTVNWMNSGNALVVLTMIYIWKNYGYIMIIMLGGLQCVTHDTIEASQLDGAGFWSRILKIVLPEMRNYIAFSIIMGIVGMFKISRESTLIFGDYPNKHIYMIHNFLNNNFESLNYAKLSAASTVVFTIVLFIIIVGFYRRKTKQA